jgi:membrane fusion protein (multidrug efflux system)
MVSPKRLILKTSSNILIVLLALIMLTCAKPTQEQNNPSPNTANTEVDPEVSDDEVVPVTTEIVSTQTIYDLVTAVGTVMAYHDVMVSSETSGKVVQVLAEVGDKVTKGDTLIAVDDELPRLGVESARAQFMLAEANYVKAKRDLERSESLYEGEDISEFELEAMQLQEKSAEAQYLSAKSALGVAERQLADTRIKSPIDGRVALRHVDIGATIAPGTPVASVVFVENVKVAFSVSEKEISKIKVGLPVRVSVQAYPDKDFRGEVYTVALKAEMDTRTFPIEVVLPNRGPDLLLPGMIAQVEIEAGISDNAITVPHDAVVELRGTNIAYVTSGNSVEERKVKLGQTVGDRVIIESGLKPGENLVVSGQENLSQGRSVRVANND